MGGLSAKELLHGPTVPREGDFVENCLEDLAPEPENSDDDDEDNLYCRSEKEGTDHHPQIPKVVYNTQAWKTTPPSSSQNSTAPHSTRTTLRRIRR